MHEQIVQNIKDKALDYAQKCYDVASSDSFAIDENEREYLYGDIKVSSKIKDLLDEGFALTDLRFEEIHDLNKGGYCGGGEYSYSKALGCTVIYDFEKDGQTRHVVCEANAYFGERSNEPFSVELKVNGMNYSQYKFYRMHINEGKQSADYETALAEADEFVENHPNLISINDAYRLLADDYDLEEIYNAVRECVRENAFDADQYLKNNVRATWSDARSEGLLYELGCGKDRQSDAADSLGLVMDASYADFTRAYSNLIEAVIEQEVDKMLESGEKNKALLSLDLMTPRQKIALVNIAKEEPSWMKAALRISTKKGTIYPREKDLKVIMSVLKDRSPLDEKSVSILSSDIIKAFNAVEKDTRFTNKEKDAIKANILNKALDSENVLHTDGTDTRVNFRKTAYEYYHDINTLEFMPNESKTQEFLENYVNGLSMDSISKLLTSNHNIVNDENVMNLLTEKVDYLLETGEIEEKNIPNAIQEYMHSTEEQDNEIEVDDGEER